MDYTPRRIVELTRSGFKDDVLQSFTIWLCASCYACTVDCPKEIGITEIMYALRQRAIKEKVYPKNFPIPILVRYFFQMVRSKGRISELWLVAGLFLKTQLLKIFPMWKIGFNLMRTGRLSAKIESIRHPEELAKFLDSLPAEREMLIK